jgi:hypothetical protein
MKRLGAVRMVDFIVFYWRQELLEESLLEKNIAPIAGIAL